MAELHVALEVNGEPREVDVEPRRLLVELIREDLDLTGTHVGCDTSQCGACTVHVDGRAVKSCTMLAVQADGSSVTTIEGLSPTGRPPPAAAGVLGEARPPVRLLHAGHDHGRGRPARSTTRTRPTTEIRHAIEGNICRCTGYHNIVLAVREAARDACATAPAARRDGLRRIDVCRTDVLGTPVKRVEDPQFITGKGRYLDDIKLPGMTYLAILRSPYAHANIRSIDTSAAKADARRGRGLHRRGHPVQPAADGLAGRRRVGHPEQRQHARACWPRTTSSGRARASRRSSPRRRPRRRTRWS